jgi:hypothetical protein
LVVLIVVIVAALLAGAGIGIWSAFKAYKKVSSRAAVRNGPWSTNLANGSEKADPYTRASVAKNGILALNQTETIYYGARVDDKGEYLNGDKVYRIEGKKPDARWWSITLYGTDYFLIPNELNRYSYNMNNVQYDENGNFRFYVSNTPQEGAWLPLNNNKRFALTLRLYNPGDSVRNNPATVELPHIIAEGN